MRINMKNGFLAAFICGFMAFGAVSVPAADVPSDWAKSEVEEAAGLGIVSGEYLRDYQKPITRGEFCGLIINTLRAQDEKIINNINADGIKFTDTDNSDIKTAAALGIAAGVGDNKFDPNGLITRQQAARMLYKAANLSGCEEYFDYRFTDSNKRFDFPYKFADISQFEHWSAVGIQYCFQNKIMLGVGGNRFDPNGNYTREQAYLTALRLYKRFNGEGIKTYAQYNGETGKFLFAGKEYDKVYTPCDGKIVVCDGGKYVLYNTDGAFVKNIVNDETPVTTENYDVYDCFGNWLIITARDAPAAWLLDTEKGGLWRVDELHFTSDGNVLYVKENDTSDGDNIIKTKFILFERDKYAQEGYSTQILDIYKR